MKVVKRMEERDDDQCHERVGEWGSKDEKLQG